MLIAWITDVCRNAMGNGGRMKEWRRCIATLALVYTHNLFTSYKRANRTRLPEGCNVNGNWKNTKGEMLREGKKIVSHAQGPLRMQQNKSHAFTNFPTLIYRALKNINGIAVYRKGSLLDIMRTFFVPLFSFAQERPTKFQHISCKVLLADVTSCLEKKQSSVLKWQKLPNRRNTPSHRKSIRRG